jgi:uncharacterized membrane protein HdeD (DUF308 family)
MVSATDSLSTTDFGPGLRVLHRHWVWFAVIGVVLVVLGIAAVAASALTTLISVLFLSWLLVSGESSRQHAFWARPWGGLLVGHVCGSCGLIVDMTERRRFTEICPFTLLLGRPAFVTRLGGTADSVGLLLDIGRQGVLARNA